MGGGSHTGDGEIVPVDIAKNAESWGLTVLKVTTIDEFKDAFRSAQAAPRAMMIYIETSPDGPNPPSSSWWDVPVSQVSRIESTTSAYTAYEAAKREQRWY